MRILVCCIFSLTIIFPEKAMMSAYGHRVSHRCHNLDICRPELMNYTKMTWVSGIETDFLFISKTTSFNPLPEVGVVGDGLRSVHGTSVPIACRQSICIHSFKEIFCDSCKMRDSLDLLVWRVLLVRQRENSSVSAGMAISAIGHQIYIMNIVSTFYGTLFLG